ncbi:MAG: HAD-IA family hydrolase [Lachnospiraceae bacterium]|nr:HAD-IA family hydrolase [Lachnospiraceae bacterium]
MKWDCILFDLDGTLLDTSVGVLKAVKYTIDKMGLPPVEDEIMKTFIGPPIYESFQSVYQLSQEQVDEATETFRDAYKDRFLLEATPYEGIYELLDFLKEQGCKLAVATNKRHDYTMKLLEHFDFPRRFDYILGSDFANTMKKADIIKTCLKELQVTDSKNAIIVGDTIHDYNGAQIAGVRFVGIDYGFGFKAQEDYELVGEEPVLSNLDELKEYLIR